MRVPFAGLRRYRPELPLGIQENPVFNSNPSPLRARDEEIPNYPVPRGSKRCFRALDWFQCGCVKNAKDYLFAPLRVAPNNLINTRFGKYFVGFEGQSRHQEQLPCVFSTNAEEVQDLRRGK